MDISEIRMSDELKEKAKACTSPEQVMELAKSKGIELSIEDLDEIGGGWSFLTDPIHGGGDERDDIDESLVSEAFMTGELRGDGLD